MKKKPNLRTMKVESKQACRLLIVIILSAQAGREISAAATQSNPCDTPNRTQTGCAKQIEAPKLGLPANETKPTRSTTTTVRPDLITRTTGAIYNALSSVFSFEDQDQYRPTISPQPVQITPRQTTTTTRPPNNYSSSPAAPTMAPSATNKSAMINLPKATIVLNNLTNAPSNNETKQLIQVSSTTSRPPPTTLATVSLRPTPNQTQNPTQQAKPTLQASNKTLQAVEPINHQFNIKDRNQPQANSTSTALNGPRLLSVLGAALDTIYTIGSAIQYLNRTVRLAPNHTNEEEAPIQDGLESKSGSKFSNLILKDGESNMRQLASEDVHLLCKLLHNHLHSNGTLIGGNLISGASSSSTTLASVSTTSKTTTTTTTTATAKITQAPTAATTVSPKTNQDSTPLQMRDLNFNLHSKHLLRSVFKYNKTDFNYRDERSVEKSAEHLLELLFNDASRMRSNGRKSDAAASDLDYEQLEPSAGSVVSDDATKNDPQNSTDLHVEDYTYRIKSLHNKTFASRGQLHLVYWLIQRHNSSGLAEDPATNLAFANAERGSNKARFKLVSAPEAMKLLDELDHSIKRRYLDKARLNFIGDLVANYSQKFDDKLDQDHEYQPHIIDDEQTDHLDEEHKPKSGLQLLLNRLSDSSFVDNLHLYLIIFIAVLFAIILCFALPMLCCRPTATANGRPKQPPVKRQQQQQQRRRRPISESTQASRSVRQDQIDTNPSSVSVIGLGEQQKGDSPLARNQDSEHNKRTVQLSDSIWRKLSSSTTTLIKDQSELVRSDGTIAVPVIRDNPGAGVAGSIPKGSQFNWYSFEDRLEEEERHSREVASTRDRQSQTYHIMSTDRRKLTKSVQTTKPDSLDENPANSSTELEFQDQVKRKSSDTLTKSELVLLKEKLVPIAQQHQQHTRQAASQTSDPIEPVYVNQSAERADIGKQAQLARGVQQELPRQAGSGARSARLLSSEQPSRFIDSTESRPSSLSEVGKSDNIEQVVDRHLTGALERVPKMRHLELPPRTRSKVDAIKAELSKLEQRDQRLPTRSSYTDPLDLEKITYKRYDVI